MSVKPLVFQVAFSTPWFAIEESVPERSGDLPYYRMTGPNGVICLPITPEGDIVMVRQFRPNLEKVTLETPAGGIDGDESIEQAARREIIEETGYQAGQIVLLGSGRLHLNRTTHKEFLALAFDTRRIEGAIVESGLEPVLVTRDQFRELILADQFEHLAALTFIGLASVKLGVHLLSDSIDLIRQKLQEELQRRA